MTVIYLVSFSCSTASDNLRRAFILHVIFSMSETRRIPGVIREHKVSFFPCFIRLPHPARLLSIFRLFRRLRWNLLRLLRFVVPSSTIAQANSAPGVVINFAGDCGKRPRDPNKDCFESDCAALRPPTETSIFAGQLFAKVSRVVDTELP